MFQAFLRTFFVASLIFSNYTFAQNVVADQATKSGIKKCNPAIKDVSTFLIKDGNAGAHSIWNSKNPDQQIFTTVIERNFNEADLVTSLTVAPVTSGQCTAIYDQISYSPKSCVAVAKETFGKYEYKGTVNKNVVILESGDVYVYLLPAGNGCVSLKKEVILDANPK